MNITFNELVLKNFKSHKDLTVAFSPITRIQGTNGAGKSSIGEAVTWVLYGVDTLGNTLIKALSPEPTNYAYDRVEVHLLLTVDEKQIRISRMIEKGKAVFYINDDPKTATVFKEIVESLFDKNMFLSLFNPLYFFTQKWEEQRAQLLQYVSQPTNSEVFPSLKKLHADTLTPLLKQKSLADLEARHKDNKTRQDKQVPFLSGQVKVFRDDYKQAPKADENALGNLSFELAAIEDSLKEVGDKETKRAQSQQSYNKLRSELEGVKIKADNMRQRYTKVKEAPIDDTCDKCGQALNEETQTNVRTHIETELANIKANYNELVASHKDLKIQLDEIVIPEIEANDYQALHNKRRDIENQIAKLNAQTGLAAKLADAEQQEQTARDSHNESVLILDAIKAFKAAEAELMAQKIADLFPTLTLELYQENKGDGERKPFFEIYQDGKPFRKLSQAESVKAGLELVDVLSSQSLIVAPVFIDGAESIITYKAPAGQLIECRVADKPLTITEVEN